MFKDKCSEETRFGMHTTGGIPWICLRCGAVDDELKKEFEERGKARLEASAGERYRLDVQNVALQILQTLMQQNMVATLKSALPGGEGARAPQGFIDMIDSSLIGAIHFVTELSKLKPSERFVEHYKSTLPEIHFPTPSPVPNLGFDDKS